MKASLFFILCLNTMFLTSVAQEPEPEEPKRGFDKSKLFVGGNFALNFGNITIINISPQLGYRFNRYFAAGVGINGMYSSLRTQYYNGTTASRENFGVVGLNIFGRVYPIEQLLLQVQPELNYTWSKLKIYGPPDQIQNQGGKIVPSMLVGAGAALPAGRGVFLVMVQYDLLHNDRTPYGDRIFYNFGYNFGF